MKIIHYIPSIDHSSGGTSTHMQLLAKELGKLVELHVVTHRSQRPVTIENAQIHYLSDSLLQFYSAKKQWQKLLKDIRPDMVHINGCWNPLCAYTQMWAQQSGYKAILIPHGMLEPWIIQRHHWTRKVPALYLYQKKAVQTANYIHSTAESEKQNLLQLGYNDKICIIPYGIELKNTSIKSSWEKTKTILYLSRIHPKKGIELLIDAVTQIRDVLTGYKIIIAGEGDAPYVQSLKNRIQEQNTENIFDFVGGVYGEKKWTLFHDADVFILPTYSENGGIVVIEALASGTPAIVSKGAPWQELNTHRCGWWIDNDVNTIAQTLKEAIALPEEEYRQMGIRGRELIKENYSIEIVAQKMKQLYEWILGQAEKPEFVYEAGSLARR
ncbi:MAG: glycosyltransferase [Bacteroidales bacterium]|jgi:glycosyltransferase involved in cell wall biosynthesis|nr:glycosyltransferase [Bacteroidales bacterium]